MALESDFLQLSTQVITVLPLSTHTGYGAPTWSTQASTWRAYVEPGNRVVVSVQGVEEISTATIYVFSSSASIGPQDKLTLPDGRVPRILRVDVLNDQDGQHHLEVVVA